MNYPEAFEKDCKAIIDKGELISWVDKETARASFKMALFAAWRQGRVTAIESAIHEVANASAEIAYGTRAKEVLARVFERLGGLVLP